MASALDKLVALAVENSDSEYSYEYEMEDDDVGDESDQPSPSRKRNASRSPDTTANFKTTGLEEEEEEVASKGGGGVDEDFRLGSVCKRCHQEVHFPMVDCAKVVQWKARQHVELPTIPPAVLQVCLKRYVREAAKDFKVSVAEAGRRLRQHGWNRYTVAHRLAEEQDAQAPLAAANKDRAEKVTPPPADNSCLICMEDDLPEAEMMSMECDHAFCQTCWRGLIETMLEDGNLDAASCPNQDCPLTVSEDLVQRVASDLVPRFDEIQLDSFVRAQRLTLRTCPGCDWIAVKPRPGLLEGRVAVTGVGLFGRGAALRDHGCLNCQTHFCHRCGRKSHEGYCQLEQRLDDRGIPYAMLGPDEEEGVMKACPKCTVEIQKMGGCNRMTCKCGHYFCWLCLGDYPSYGGHFCGNQPYRPRRGLTVRRVNVDLAYVSDALKDKQEGDGVAAEGSECVMEQILELERYAHYHNRFYAHEEGQRFAQKTCPWLGVRDGNNADIVSFWSDGSVDFIKSACKTLVASRRLIKNTYLNSFFMQLETEEDTQTYNLRFAHLERLERFTEELSEISENPDSKQYLERVLELIDIVFKCMKNLAEFENEVASARPPTAIPP